MSNRLLCLLLSASLFAAGAVEAAGNTTIESFNKAKKILEHQVYQDHRITFYCLASFDRDKNITLPEGFVTPEHQKRAKRVEWEHVVPAENFGRFFSEWRDGSPECVDSKGRSFKGRKCAEKASREYRFMQADLYNLYPAIGAVHPLQFQLPDASGYGGYIRHLSDEGGQPPGRAAGIYPRADCTLNALYG